MYNKILITGNAGAGKTTLSRHIAQRLNIDEVIHLDRLVWTKTWQAVSKATREPLLNDIAKKPAWLVDGVSKTILENADTIVFLDYPRRLCYFRVLKRLLKHGFRSRPELPGQSPEIRVFKKVLKIIWRFPKTVKPVITRHLKEHANSKTIFHVTNKKELLSVIAFFVE